MIVGIVLAAGRGRRIGTPKALLSLHGRSFLDRAVDVLQGAGIDVLAVLNEEVRSAVGGDGAASRIVLNPDPDQQGGMIGSIRLGIAEALRLGASGALLLPVDHPWVSSRDVTLIAESLRAGAAIVIPTCQGRRGHPIGVARIVMEEIVAEPLAESLRETVRRDRERVVEVPASSGVIEGVNTPEDLERARNRTFR